MRDEAHTDKSERPLMGTVARVSCPWLRFRYRYTTVPHTLIDVSRPPPRSLFTGKTCTVLRLPPCGTSIGDK